MSENIANTLGKLSTYTNVGYPILSVYLSLTEPLIQYTFGHIVNSNLSDSQKRMVSNDIAYIDSFLGKYSYTPSSEGLALFSGGNHLWEVIHTPFALPQLAKVDYSPYLQPLIRAREPYKQYLVVVADRKKALFFILSNGVIQEQGSIEDASVPQDMKGRHTQGEATHISRHILDHIHRHLQLISQKVEEFTENKIISGVVIGGHEELLKGIHQALPKHLQKKIMGQFITSVRKQAIETIVEKSKTIISKYEK